LDLLLDLLRGAYIFEHYEQSILHFFSLYSILDLQINKLSDFSQILNLKNMKSLKVLLLMANEIKQVYFPDCEYDEKLKIFQNLETIFLRDNPIANEVSL
jgi:hypothetical protein